MRQSERYALVCFMAAHYPGQDAWMTNVIVGLGIVTMIVAMVTHRKGE